MSRTIPAEQMKYSVTKALSYIEKAIEADPSHIRAYTEIKNMLLNADKAITFCIED